MRSLVLVVSLVASALAPSSVAQSAGALRGHVTDPSGANVLGATIRLRALESGRESRKTTSAEGAYEFRNIVPGNYSIRIEKTGFAPYQVDEVAIAGALTMNVELTLATQAQSVTVEGEAAGVTTDPTENAGALVLKEGPREFVRRSG